MILVKNPTTGDWIQVAGNGKAEYGASTVRSGAVVYSLTDNAPISKTIAFDSAMPDSDYLLEIDTGSSKVSCGNITKSASGFTCFLRNNDSAEVAGRTFSYTAFKLYTDTEYNSLLDLPENVSALQTGKQDILTVSQTTIAVANGGIKLAKYGRIVQASFQIVADNISADFTSGVWTRYGNAGIIPAAYRPLIPVYCGKMVTEMPVLMRVTTDGTLQYYWTGGTLGYEYEWTKTWISAQ